MHNIILKLIDKIVSMFNKNQQTENDNTDPEEQNTNQDPEQNEPEQEMNNYSKLMVHLDAGHASTTPGQGSPAATFGITYGTHSVSDLTLKEYEYNRKVVAEVDRRLRSLGFNTYIVTPEVDYDVPLSTRANRSNTMALQHPASKHIFSSAHVNAVGDGKTWYVGKDRSYWCAFTTKGQTAGDKLADCFYEAADEILPKYGKKIASDTSDGDRDKEENYTVLKKTNSPAVLVESLFMTNVDDVLFLKSDEGFNAIVEIYVRAVIKYFDKYIK